MTRQEQISQFQRVNRKLELKFMPKVQRAIHTQVKPVISDLRDGGYDQARRNLMGVASNEQLAKVIKELYTTVGRRWAQITYSRLLQDERNKKNGTIRLQLKGFGFNYAWTQFIINYLEKFLLDKITFQVAATTRDALLRVLATATAAGWSIDQTVDRLNDWPYERFQAARIVRTETNRAANVGSAAQAEASEYQQVKEWMSAHDNRVRGNPVNGAKDHADHWALDEIKIDAEDVFHDIRNGDQLMFPGDPAASAASVINCRCHASYTFKRDANGNLIKKRKSTTVIYPGQTTTRQVVTV
jgi:hypothetical protein